MEIANTQEENEVTRWETRDLTVPLPMFVIFDILGSWHMLDAYAFRPSKMEFSARLEECHDDAYLFYNLL